MTSDNANSLNQIYLFGAGGLGRELASELLKNGVSSEQLKFVVDDEYFEENFSWSGLGISRFQTGLENLVVALGHAESRADIAERMGGWQNCAALVLGDVGMNVRIGSGVIVAPGAHVTCDVQIGEGTLVQMDSTIAHDCILGSSVSVNPGARINGAVTIGNRTTIGSQACIREGISICQDVTIGMGAVVVKNIEEQGVYVGNPARRIK